MKEERKGKKKKGKEKREKKREGEERKNRRIAFLMGIEVVNYMDCCLYPRMRQKNSISKNIISKKYNGGNYNQCTLSKIL